MLHRLVRVILVWVESLVTAVAAAYAALLERVPPARTAAANEVLRLETALVGVFAAQRHLLASPLTATRHCAHFSLRQNELRNEDESLPSAPACDF